MPVKLKVYGLWCYTCGEFIYSRARHDYHACACGDPNDSENGTGCTIDGGFEYIHTGWGKGWRGEATDVEIEVNINGIGYFMTPRRAALNRDELRADIAKLALDADYQKGENKYGRIQKGQRPYIPPGLIID